MFQIIDSVDITYFESGFISGVCHKVFLHQENAENRPVFFNQHPNILNLGHCLPVTDRFASVAVPQILVTRVLTNILSVFCERSRSHCLSGICMPTPNSWLQPNALHTCKIFTAIYDHLQNQPRAA